MIRHQQVEQAALFYEFSLEKIFPPTTCCGLLRWEAAGFLGMSPEVLQDTYGHHHPDHLQGAAAAIGRKGRYVSVAETVASLTEDRNQTKNSNDFWSEWQDSNLRPLRPERSALPG